MVSGERSRGVAVCISYRIDRERRRPEAVENQLNDTQQKLRQTADAARKQIARLSMVLALSMLIGAFIASTAAALGGRIRDEY